MAREKIYSLTSYPDPPHHGPFFSDGTVNWELLESISSIMKHNISDFKEMLEMDVGMRMPWDIEDARPVLRSRDEEEADWAHAGGEWKGMYAFLDYTVFMVQ